MGEGRSVVGVVALRSVTVGLGVADGIENNGVGLILEVESPVGLGVGVAAGQLEVS